MVKDDIITGLVVLAIVVGLVFGLAALSRYECAQKTEYMGFDSRFSLFAGCQINVEEGKWIPLDSYYFKEE